MDYQIFMSYRRAGGSAMARLLYERLKNDGFNVFLDIEEMQRGKFDEQICRRIAECSDFVLILPPKALERRGPNDWVYAEIAEAIRNKKNIVPVMMSGFQFPSSRVELPDEIRDIMLYEAVEVHDVYFDAAYKRIVSLLTSRTQKKPAPRSMTIEHRGDPAEPVWKYPHEEFISGAKLVVHEKQEALLYQNGEVLKVFGAGLYTLSVQEVPQLAQLVSSSDNGKQSFRCGVFFVNLADQMPVKWETDSRVEYMDPVYKTVFQIDVCGEMSLCVTDSYCLLERLEDRAEKLSRDSLKGFLCGILMTHLKTRIVSLIREQKIDIFSIDEKLTGTSEILRRRLMPDFGDYGLALKKFDITCVRKPEKDPVYMYLKKMNSLEPVSKRDEFSCPFCGTMLPNHAAFCLHCGKKVADKD